MKIGKRLLSLLLCFVMLVGLMPTTAFAWTAPTLSGDGGGTWNIQLSAEGVLTWNDMGSTTYDIQVDKTALGGTVTKIQGISGTSYNLINRFKELKIENGTYVFYIKENDTDTTSGDVSFRYVSPEDKLSEPQNLRWDGTVAKWNSVANATEYNVILYTESGSVQLSKTTTATQYDWSTNVYNEGFWFEVVATGDNYRNSNAAEGPKYDIYSCSWTAPPLTGGKAEWNVTLSDDGMLRWNDMGSATYEICVDETAMGGTVTNIYGINTNAFNLINRFKTLKLENGTYYFTIKANDTSETSGTISFRYVSPESKLSAPQNLQWDGTVAKWDSVANATEYEVRLYSDSGSLQLSKTTSETRYDWSTNVYNDGFWFEVIATAADYRDSNPAESPKYGSPLVPNTYTVTYDANGGTGTMASENLTVDGGFAKTYTFPQCGFTAPSGKEFDKWQWYYNSNPSQTTDTTPGNSPWLSGSITVKALWKDKSNTYTVTYDANGGSGSMGTEYIAFENDGFAKTYTFPQCGFTAPDGKEFDKWQWYYNSDPSQTTDTTPGNSPWLSGSITVKALWKDVLNDIFTSQPTNKSGKIGANIEVPVVIDITQVPDENTAYIVLEVQNGGNWDKVAESNRSNWVGSFDVSSNTACTKTYRYKVYNGAQWNESDTFTVEFQPLVVTFVDNEHSTQTEPINVTTYNTTIAKPNNPTYAGDTFYGWHWPYWNFESDVVTQDITLYAQWAGRGFYGDIPNVSAKVGEKARIILSNVNYNNSPTYVYKYDGANWVQVDNVTNYGWYDLPASAEGKTETYKIVICHSRNIESNEFTVTWANTVYTVSFNANGGTGTMTAATVESGAEYTLPACTFTAPSGKQFKAWSVGGVEKAVGDKITVTANTTVTAQWETVETWTVQVSSENVCGVSGSYNATQYVEQGQAMTDIIITANDGYYFPNPLTGTLSSNGVTATRNSYTQVTISGIPTAGVYIGFGPVAKSKELQPTSVEFVATGADTGNLTGLENGVSYSVTGAATAEFTASGTTHELTNVVPGTLNIVKKATDPNTKLDSDAHTYPVGKNNSVPNLNSTNCSDSNNNNGQIWNVSAEMEYQKEGDNNWTTGTDANVTGLTPGTYYVRYKASSINLAGNAQTINIAAYNVPTLTGTVEITGDAKFGEQLTADVSGITNNTGTLSYQWKRNETNISGANSATYTLVEADIGSTIKVVVTSSVESGSITSNATAAVEKADGPVAPTGLAGVSPTTNGGSDGKITGTADTMEYSTDSSFANPVGTACSATETAGLTAGTYYVRYKETTTHKAGAYATVVVPAYVAANTYTVTVTNGTATPTGPNAAGTNVTITADSPPQGKMFDKWEVSGVTVADETAATITFIMPAGNVTAKATYKDVPPQQPTTYTVTFDSNGGTGTMADVTGVSGEYTLPANGFTALNGMQFKAWAIGSPNGEQKQPNEQITITGDTTIYAIWENIPPQQPTTYTVTFDSNGGTGTMADVTGVSGEYTLPANGFTAPLSKWFKCWSVGGAEKAVGDKITVTANTTVTAVWAGNTYNPRPNYPIYINPTPSSSGQFTAAKTFDGGIGLSVAVTILSAAGGAWLAKKKED